MKKFRKIYVEITNICNMHCSFCPETKRAKAFMSCMQFEHIAKEIVPYTDYVYLHVKGEPLLHPELESILDICKKYNLKVNISTNGVLLQDKYDVLKKGNIRQLNISLHSFENGDIEDMKKYIDNVFSICDKLADADVIIRYKLWNATRNNYNGYILSKLEELYHIQLENIPYSKDRKLRENIFLSIKKPFTWPSLEKGIETNNKCHALKEQIAILVDGTVVPCCVDNNGDINLGNIFKEDLGSILNGKRAQAIRKGFEDNKCVEKLCKKCEYKTYVTQM